MNLTVPDVLERLDDAFVALDASWRFAHVNSRACELLGAPRESLIGRSLWEEFPDGDGPLPAACRRALRERAPARVEELHPRLGRRFELRIRPLPDGLSILFEEAGERQGAEFRRQEAYFRSLTEYSADLVAVMEPDGIVRYQNPASVRVIGYTAEEMVGLDAFSLVHPEDLGAVREAFARALRSPGESVSARFRFRHRDGSWRFMEADCRNLLHDEAVHGIVVNSRDVTERVTAEERLRESEERYRLVTRATNDVVWDYDVSADRAYRGEALASTYGIGREAEEEPDRGWWEAHIHPEDRERVVAGLREALEGDASAWNDEYRFRRGDGSYAIVFDRGLIRRDAEGRPVRMIGSMQDLTEKREAEMELRALFAAMQDVIMVIDAEGRYLKVAPASPHLLYRPSRELLGRTLHDVLPRAQADHLIEALRAALESGEKVDLEYELTIDGEEHWFTATVSPMTRETVVWVARDITVRRRSEEALRASERRYREIFEQSRDAMYVTRVDGTLLDVNAAGQEVFGAPREELLRHTITDFYADASQRAGMLRAIQSNGAIRDQELRLRRIDGREFDALVSASLRREAGEAVGIQGSVRDITERKETERRLRAHEARFRSLVENVHDIIVVLDADGRIRYATPSGTRALGYSRRELRHHTLLDLIHPEDQPQVEAALARLAREGKEPVTLSVRVRARDGSWQVHDAIAQSLLHDPAVRGIVITSHDVTEQRLLEAQLRQAQKMEAVGRLAGGVAHDFNNVLMAITGFAALLEGEIQPTPDASLFLTEIHKAADRAASLTRQLLAFGRKQALRPKVVNLNSVVEGAGTMLRRLIREDVDLGFRLSARLGQCRVDPHQVEQVLVNLVVNATDALPGGGTIEISTRNRTIGERERRTQPYIQPGSYISLSVRDTGHGMDAETLARAFDPFFTTKEQGKGTGLGLSMVYGIIKQSDGYVWAESQPGEGTTFTVLLPRSGGEEDGEGAPAASGPLREGRGTILLVEDEDSVRLLARLTLRKAGYTVLEARDGEEALRIAREHPGDVDLLLTDVVMPHLGGYALAQRLRESYPSLRVVYMTGYAGDSRAGAPAGGAELLLAKPITPESLTLRVREALK